MDSDKSSFLFTEKSIGKLLARFALPAIFAQLANSLYLIVDQVLLANSAVGTIGFGATSVAFPILTAANALAFLFGGGGASFAALRLGEGDSKAGRRALWWSTVALLGSSLLVMFLGLWLLAPILGFFGATDTMLPYATEYSRILCWGLPLIALSGALSYWVRADGSPGFSMGIMVAGAVLNVAFDWLFLFPFDWGIAGVAWAMVLSRSVSALLGLWYLRKRAKHFSLSPGGPRATSVDRRVAFAKARADTTGRESGERIGFGWQPDERPDGWRSGRPGTQPGGQRNEQTDGWSSEQPGRQHNEQTGGLRSGRLAGWKALRSVVALGSSGFLMQCAIVVVQIVTNRSLRQGAVQAALDPSVAIGAMGVVTKANGILIALVTGLASGAQPILGFHKGAGHEKEVRKTYWLSVLWATVAAFACWGITVFGTRWVAALFAGDFSGHFSGVGGGSDAASGFASGAAGSAGSVSGGAHAIGAVDTAFLSTTVWFMRTYLLAIFTAGFQLISSYYFQATGRPWKACLLTLSRQLFLLVPLILMMSRIFGLQGILYAGPLADAGAAVIAGIFVWKEWRGIRSI